MHCKLLPFFKHEKVSHNIFINLDFSFNSSHCHWLNKCIFKTVHCFYNPLQIRHEMHPDLKAFKSLIHTCLLLVLMFALLSIHKSLHSYKPTIMANSQATPTKASDHGQPNWIQDHHQVLQLSRLKISAPSICSKLSSKAENNLWFLYSGSVQATS